MNRDADLAQLTAAQNMLADTVCRRQVLRGLRCPACSTRRGNDAAPAYQCGACGHRWGPVAARERAERAVGYAVGLHRQRLVAEDALLSGLPDRWLVIAAALAVPATVLVSLWFKV